MSGSVSGSVSAGRHGSLPRKTWNRKGGPYSGKTREEILKEVEERVKVMMKGLLESILREEQAMYLEQHPTKANGYSTRDLLTLVGPLEDLHVPRVREGDFHPKILPVSATDLPRTFRSRPRPLRLWGKHPRHLSLPRRDLRRVLLAPEHLPAHPGGGGAGLAGASVR